jgi:hypothetical protein
LLNIDNISANLSHELCDEYHDRLKKRMSELADDGVEMSDSIMISIVSSELRLHNERFTTELIKRVFSTFYPEQ